MSEIREPQSAAPAEHPSVETVSVVVQGETARYQNYLVHQVGLQFVGPSRGYAGTTTPGRVWFMTAKLGLTVRQVPPEVLARFLNALGAKQAEPRPSPSTPASGEGAAEAPAPHRGGFVQALEASRRARRDGSRSSFEAYLVYQDGVGGRGGRRAPRLNSGHWQPHPFDTVSGLAEGKTPDMREEWEPESYVDPRLFSGDDDSDLHASATLPGSERWG
jgi:hypothetical protein